jgi:CysZ protein
MLTDLLRAIRMLGEPRARGVVWLGIALSLATLAALVFGVEALVSWASDTGYGWVDRTLEVLSVLGTLVVAWFLFPAIVVAVSSSFLERVVDATEDRYHPGLPPPRLIPIGEAVPAALRLLGLSLLLNLLALPLYFVPLLNLPVWLALNGYLVGREYAELVGLRRLDPARVGVVRRNYRLMFWTSGALIAFLLAVPLVNLVAPVLGAAFMALRFQRYCGDATHALRGAT